MSVPLRHWGATTAEVASSMPGDDLIIGRALNGTRSINIDADPELVFDYIAQMGFGQAGWYSYDLLDNLGRKSATRINPTWLVKTAGEEVPGGPISFVAAIVDRPTAYVLQVPSQPALGHTVDFTLAYRLDPIASGTRVVTRVRIGIDGLLGTPLERALLAGDGLMVRKQLLGLKARAEAHG